VWRSRTPGGVGQFPVECDPVDHRGYLLVPVEAVAAAVEPIGVKPRPTDGVLQESLPCPIGGELPDVGADVARTGKRLPNLSLLEGDHVQPTLGETAGEP